MTKIRHTAWALGAAALVLGAIAGPTAVPAWGRASAAPRARAAGSVNLVESGRLKLVNEEGSTIYEQGRVTGTYAGSVSASFVIRAHAVTVSVTFRPSGGSIAGLAHASYTVDKNLGSFDGTLTIEHGTGKFAHISAVGGSDPKFSGVINRGNLQTEVKVSGEVDL